jgi:hypothetical protein
VVFPQLPRAVLLTVDHEPFSSRVFSFRAMGLADVALLSCGGGCCWMGSRLRCDAGAGGRRAAAPPCLDPPCALSVRPRLRPEQLLIPQRAGRHHPHGGGLGDAAQHPVSLTPATPYLWTRLVVGVIW